MYGFFNALSFLIIKQLFLLSNGYKEEEMVYSVLFDCGYSTYQVLIPSFYKEMLNSNNDLSHMCFL
jgi:hypothetical protein